MVEKIRGAGSHQVERRQSCLVFIDEVKEFAGFKTSFKCVEGRWVSNCVWEVIPGFCWSLAMYSNTVSRFELKSVCIFAVVMYTVQAEHWPDKTHVLDSTMLSRCVWRYGIWHFIAILPELV